MFFVGDFFEVLKNKLGGGGTVEEKCICITIIWSIAANSQKAKYILKTSGIDDRLQEVLKHWKLTESSRLDKKRLNNLQYIIEMIGEGI